MSSIYELLDQDVYWEPKDKSPIKLEAMSPAHIHNLLSWLERRAPMLKERLAWHFLLSGPREGSSDAVCDAFDSAMDEFDRELPIIWLNERPLVKKLRELQRAYREAEVKLAKTRQPLFPAGADAQIKHRHHDRPAAWEGTLRGLV